MSIQRYTICKIGGAAAEPVLEKFKLWHARDQAVQESDSMEWDAAELLIMKQFVDTLRTHSAELPVIYFSEYIDMWTVGSSLFPLLQNAPEAYLVRADFTMACVRIDPQLDISALIPKPVIRYESNQDQEDMWFLTHLWHSLRAWEKLIPTGAVVVIRESLGGPSPDDPEVLAKCREVPAWLK